MAANATWMDGGQRAAFRSIPLGARETLARREVVLALTDRDMKILWSRAAGLCSFPDCREILVRFSKGENGMYQIGEMAHLIARSLKGPRGIGTLAADALDSYENHILLCPTCHPEIDVNPSDWPIEKLAAFKAEHEHWVAETLLTHVGEKIGFLKFYASLLERLERILQFDKWAWSIGHLWRDLAPAEAIDSVVAARVFFSRRFGQATGPDWKLPLRGYSKRGATTVTTSRAPAETGEKVISMCLLTLKGGCLGASGVRRGKSSIGGRTKTANSCTDMSLNLIAWSMS